MVYYYLLTKKSLLNKSFKNLYCSKHSTAQNNTFSGFYENVTKNVLRKTARPSDDVFLFINLQKNTENCKEEEI
jgi:hypothetical protein